MPQGNVFSMKHIDTPKGIYANHLAKRDKTVTVIVNPAAGDMTPAQKLRLVYELKNPLEDLGYSLSIIYTGEPGEITERLLFESRRSKLILFAGGDGTVLEAIGDGLYSDSIYEKYSEEDIYFLQNTKKIIIPLGSVNLLAREFGCNKYSIILKLALEALGEVDNKDKKYNEYLVAGLKVSWVNPETKQPMTKIGASLVNSGLDSDLFWKLNEASVKIRRQKVRSFFVMTLSSTLSIIPFVSVSKKVVLGFLVGFKLAYEALSNKYKIPTTTICVNGEEIEANINICCNIVTVANGWKIFPDCDPTDNVADIAVIPKITVLNVFKAMFFCMMHRGYLFPGIKKFAGVKGFSFKTKKDEIRTFCIDGESYQFEGEVKVEVKEKIFRLSGSSLMKDNISFRGKVFDYFYEKIKKRRERSNLKSEIVDLEKPIKPPDEDDLL